MANEPIKKTFTLPDGYGSEQDYFFKTSADQVKMSEDSTLAEKFASVFDKMKKNQAEKMTPSKNDIKLILNNEYLSSGGNGEGELNGVPTSAEIAAILNGTYSHVDKELDEFAPNDVITSNDVKKILNGTY